MAGVVGAGVEAALAVALPLDEGEIMTGSARYAGHIAHPQQHTRCLRLKARLGSVRTQGEAAEAPEPTPNAD